MKRTIRESTFDTLILVQYIKNKKIVNNLKNYKLE